MNRVAQRAVVASATAIADLERAFEQHGEFVHTLTQQLLHRGADADDSTQNIFVAAWRKLPEWRGSSPRIWLAQLTVREVAAAHRRAWLRDRLRLVGAPPTQAREPASSGALVDDACANAAFHDATARLGESERTAFVLAELHDFTPAEIAEVLGCDVPAARSHLANARREFERYFAPTARTTTLATR